MDNSHESNPNWRRLQLIWSLFALALFYVTLPLWISTNEFPVVPLLAPLASTVFQSAWIDGVLLGSLLVLIFINSIRSHSRLWLSIVILLSIMFLLNQHRLQPWAFHLFLGSTVFACCSRESGVRLLKWLSISIYIYSAVGKLDYQFMHTVGLQFLETVLAWTGLTTDDLPVATAPKLTLIFPAFELLVASLLLFRKTRVLGVYAAIFLHSLIILILSPLGLDHKPGVLIWNGLFIAMIPYLFLPMIQSANETKKTFTNRMASLVIMAACLLPILESFGKYDHWLAWGLYSPRNSRAQINIHLYKVGEIKELEPYMRPQLGDTPFRSLDLRKWSLEELNVPLYPQDRFQLAVARHIAHRYNLDSGIEVHLLGIANRFTGQRDVEILRGKHEIDMRCQQFFFSTKSIAD